MLEVVLYGTFACHLCEQAEEIILKHEFDIPWKFVKRDIVDNDDWLERYRVNIPVVEINNSELFWPFDDRQLEDFIKTIGFNKI